MSPRRRLFVGAVVVVLAVVVTAFVVLRMSRQTTVAVPQDRLGPVILVPGYGGDATALDRLAIVLRAAGREVSVLALPGDGTGPLADQAQVLDDAADRAIAAGAPSVDVVGYSAGGVVARLWVAEQGGGSKARRIVTLGSPHHGTEVAELATVFAPSSCPDACQQLAPDSDVLGRLNRGDETPSGPLWESIWTTNDDVVTPPSSASIDGAVDVRVQDVCPGRQVGHGQLPTDPAVQALVVEALGVAAPSAPSRCPVRS